MQTFEEQIALLQRRAEEHALLAQHVSDVRAQAFNTWAAIEYRALAKQLTEASASDAAGSWYDAA